MKEDFINENSTGCMHILVGNLFIHYESGTVKPNMITVNSHVTDHVRICCMKNSLVMFHFWCGLPLHFQVLCVSLHKHIGQIRASPGALSLFISYLIGQNSSI